MASTETEPQSREAQTIVPVSRRAADRLRAGHTWVYRSELLPVAPDAQPAPGALVTVTDGRRLALGSGLYSTSSEIAVRLLSDTPGLTRPALLTLLRDRIAAAIHLRDDLTPRTPETNARRLLFSEADGLPGLIADQYNDLIVVQRLTQGMAQPDIRDLLREALTPAFAGRGGTMWERSDPRTRELEQLPATNTAEPLATIPPVASEATPEPAATSPADTSPEATPAPTTPAASPAATPRSETVFTLNGLHFHYSAAAGQKTGAFLDQRLNYQAAALHAHGRALDICTYHGGFALHLARTCRRVTGVDQSRAALEVADRNLDLNRASNTGIQAEVDWIEADAFALLRAFADAGERFDTVVLDPPAFSKSRRAAEAALRGYKELNLQALRLLNPGGTLVTCSCSHHVPLPDFQEVLRTAAADTHRRVQLLETRGAAPDHPAILTLPETTYLKCLITRVS